MAITYSLHLVKDFDIIPGVPLNRFLKNLPTNPLNANGLTASVSVDNRTVVIPASNILGIVVTTV